jgi:hypothetical protein
LRGPEGDLRRTVTTMLLLSSSKRASVIVSPWPSVTRTVECYPSGRRNPSIWVAAAREPECRADRQVCDDNQGEDDLTCLSRSHESLLYVASRC